MALLPLQSCPFSFRSPTTSPGSSANQQRPSSERYALPPTLSIDHLTQPLSGIEPSSHRSVLPAAHQVCYSTLIYDLNLLDPTCLRHSLSKVLGLGIVVGGSIVKLPQIHTLLRTRSAHGLSLPAYALETLGYAISLAYAWRSGFPFSTYGENVFMALQGVAIVLLVVKYGGTGGRRGSGVWGLAMALVGWVLLDHRVVSFSTREYGPVYRLTRQGR